MKDITGSSSSTLGLVQLEIILPSTEPVSVIDRTIQLIHSSMSNPTVGFAVYKHYLNAPSFDYVDKLLQTVMVGGTPLMRCRVGLGSDKLTTWLPWQVHTITGYKAIPLGFGVSSGHMVEITSCDILWVLDKVSRVVTRKGKISSIVQGILDGYNQEHIIEETDYEGFYIQSFQSDFDFIRNRMLRRSKGKRGLGNYQFFVKDGTVHYHSPDYHTDLKLLRYFSSTGKDLLKRDQGQMMLDKGVAGVRFVSYSPSTGQFKEIKTDRNRTLKLGNTIPDIERFPGAEINFPYHTTLNPEAEIQALADNSYEDARMNTYEVEATLPNSIQARHGDMLFLDISPEQKRTSDWSGYYYVKNIVVAYLKGSLASRMTLQRGEMNTCLGSTIKSKYYGMENVIEPPRTAPGIELNTQSIEASNAVHGSPGISIEGMVSTARDPNKG